ncbi:MAG: IPTL-CTERM sorting domain-containing protein [Phycisphaerae bacterium]
MRKLVVAIFVAGLASPAFAGKSGVGCDGAESGGTGGTSCPAGDPRDYAYPVFEGVGVNLSDIYIGTNDCDPANYTNICMPAGWTFAIVANPPPPPFAPLLLPPRPALWHSADKVKTPHGGGSPGPVPVAACAIHWSDGGAGTGVDPSGLFTFGYDHPWPSGDFDWEVIKIPGGPFPVTWVAPVGGGLGPVHAPKETNKSIPTVSEWGMVVMALLIFTVATIVIVRRRRPAAA